MIVDTSAIVAILRGEPDSERLTDLIAADSHPKMSAATVVELYAVTESRGQPAERHRVDNLLNELEIEIVPFDKVQAQTARDAWRDYGKGSGHPAHLNFGDCLTYGLAATTGESLIFKGDDFSHTDLNLAQ